MSIKREDIGVLVPEVLLPAGGVQMEKWAVVACDQYTSEPEYWEAVEKQVGDAPSTLRLMLPEMYLEKPGEAERIQDINRHMKQYVKDGVLKPAAPGLVLVKRTAGGKTRTGVMLALDLEQYEYAKGSKTLIRATEGTIVERIPPRLRIRKDAPLEMPHILVLIDDPEKTVIEPLLKAAEGTEPLYDFDLMQGGGHVTGLHVADEGKINAMLSALAALANPTAFAQKYRNDEPPMLFAMGDGNHSFATAKANWEELKKGLSAAERKDHPARYCLVELENVHDSGIIFEPIHRVLFGQNVVNSLNIIKEKLNDLNGSCDIQIFQRLQDVFNLPQDPTMHILPFVTAEGVGCMKVKNPASQLPVGTLQAALDVLMKELGGSLDYVHGQDVVERLGRQRGNIGFLLPSMDKSDLFATVVYDGALPRKTFSMGEAHEKRYYLECRSISK